MRKPLFNTILPAVIVTLMIIGAIRFMGRDNKKDYKKHVGETVIIKNDTLVIVNYSTLDETFILNDGRKVAFSFVDKDTKDE